MIIGDGDIASALKEVDRKDWIFFASGVSNSAETRESEFQREFNLLLEQDKTKHLIYFSTLSIFYKNSAYTRHKRNMEWVVKDNFPLYAIMRFGNISWGTNPNTLINHLRNEKKSGRPLEIQDVYRFVSDKDEFLFWIKMIPEWSCEMNVAGRRMKVADIVKEFVK